MDAMEGRVNMASQRARGGMLEWKTTRLAGLEMGSTKLAALAMKAQAKQIGHGTGLRMPDSCEDGWRQDDGSGIVGHEDGDDGADQVDECEEAA